MWDCLGEFCDRPKPNGSGRFDPRTPIPTHPHTHAPTHLLELYCLWGAPKSIAFLGGSASVGRVERTTS